MKRRINQAAKLFYSYSHKDEELRKKFEAHMSSLKRTGYIQDWHDRKILPGQSWEEVITNKIEESDIIVFLVSSDFLSSDYCYNKEVLRAIERHNRKECIVVPVIIRECDWEGTPFESIQGLPTDMRPVVSRHWHNIDEAYANVARGLKKIIKQRLSELETTDSRYGSNKVIREQGDMIELIVRNSMTGEEFDVDVLLDSTISDIVLQFKEDKLLNKGSDYRLLRKENREQLSPDLTLREHGILNKDTLLITNP